MKKQDQWGVAMQGCAEVITEAIKFAVKEVDKTQPLIYIEIGIGEGKTLKQICKLFTELNIDFRALGVDIENGWTLNFDEFIMNIKDYEDKVIYDLAGSPEALKDVEENSVFAVLIDGDHTLEAVIADFREADRIVMKGGLIMFHDSGIDSQGADAFERQPRGIEVREAIEHLGLLKITNREPKGLDNYRVLVDHPDEPETQSRGIFIIQKTL